MATTAPHHVWQLIPGWGSHAAAHAIIFRSLELNPALKVTVVYHALMKAKVEEDVATYPQHLRSRVLFHAFGSDAIVGVPATVPIFTKDLVDGLKSLLPGLDKPTKFIIDHLMGERFLHPIKAAFPDAKVYMWWSSSTTCLHSMVAPVPEGGADYKAVVERYIQQGSKEDRTTLIQKVVGARTGALECNGTVVRVPGMPDMYDYEREQSNVPLPPDFHTYVAAIIDFPPLTDGVLASTSYAIEGAAIEACKKHTSIIPVGVSIRPDTWTGCPIPAGAVKAFMDSQAEKSVLVVCFGSIHFPHAHLETVVANESKTPLTPETLIEIKQPFVLIAGGAGGGRLSDPLAHKVETSKTGLYHPVSLLSHPATGWLLGQAGWNSMNEAFVQGVPVITWPLAHADQSFNAALVSTGTPQLGFELLEGYSLRPTKRGVNITGTPEAVVAEFKNVIAKAFAGEEGRQIRKNVEAMRVALRQEHEGAAKERLLAFI